MYAIVLFGIWLNLLKTILYKQDKNMTFKKIGGIRICLR